MPHIARFRLNGKLIPSVNTITDSLSKDGLDRWRRRLGFEESDRIGKEAREQGHKLAAVFERYRKGGKIGKVSSYQERCLSHWDQWYAGNAMGSNPEFVEPHLVNTVDKYHGSPDMLFEPIDSYPIALGDDKSKKRHADYKVLMNEHAYAMCDSYEVDGEIKKLPWTPPIRLIWLWTYCPECGKLFPSKHEFDEQVYKDFLLCKEMLYLNRKAEKYFKRHAILLGCEHGGTNIIASFMIGKAG